MSKQHQRKENEYEITQLVEINREQAAELLAETKQILRGKLEEKERRAWESRKEEAEILYISAFSVQTLKLALSHKESLERIQKEVKGCGREACSERSFEEVFQEIVNTLSKGKTAVENPKAFLVGGQPGAGKSGLIRWLEEEFSSNIISINGDDFRKEHPNYDALLTKYGENYIEHTREFSGKMIEELILYFAARKYNLIIEGTLRDIQVPLETSRLLHRHGYQTMLHVMVVKPEKSYLGTLLRYEEMLARGMVARPTPKDFHDKVVERLPDNLQSLYLAKEFDGIALFNREGACLSSTYQVIDL